MYIDFAQPIALPPYWLNHPEVVKRVDANSFHNGSVVVNGENLEQKDLLSAPHSCPLEIGWDGNDFWRLPIEPVMAINGKNTIIKRSVLKTSEADAQRRGTVKELWGQDDYDITISGVLISSIPGELPSYDLTRLINYCTARRPLLVKSAVFTLFGIARICVEDFQFPFTKGVENQMFTIKACSDDFDTDQLLKIDVC